MGPDPNAAPHGIRNPGWRPFPALDGGAEVGLVPRLEGWPEALSRTCGRAAGKRRAAPGEFRAGGYPRQLSGGQKQRVGIARALAGRSAAAAAGRAVRRARSDHAVRFAAAVPGTAATSCGKTALFVTHDVREALMLATRIVLLRDGGVELAAAPGEFLAGGDTGGAGVSRLACERAWRPDERPMAR